MVGIAPTRNGSLSLKVQHMDQKKCYCRVARSGRVIVSTYLGMACDFAKLGLCCTDQITVATVLDDCRKPVVT